MPPAAVPAAEHALGEPVRGGRQSLKGPLDEVALVDH
jgi:hypothetical protein